MLDSYCYRTLVWEVFVERVRAPAPGRTTDETRIAAALPRAETCLRALAEIGGDGPWLAGPALTLADLHAAPISFISACRQRARPWSQGADGLPRGSMP